MTGADWVAEKKSSYSSIRLAIRTNINNEAVHFAHKAAPATKTKPYSPW